MANFYKLAQEAKQTGGGNASGSSWYKVAQQAKDPVRIAFSQYDQDILSTLKHDSSSWTYDLFDAEDMQRKAQGLMPKSLADDYDLDDPIDKYLYEQGYVNRKNFSKNYQKAEAEKATKSKFSTELLDTVAKKQKNDSELSEADAFAAAFEELRGSDTYKSTISKDDYDTYYKEYVKNSMQGRIAEASKEDTSVTASDWLNRTQGTGNALSSLGLPQAGDTYTQQKLRKGTNQSYGTKITPLAEEDYAEATAKKETTSKEEKAEILKSAAKYDESLETRADEIDKRIREINRTLNRTSGTQQTYIAPEKVNALLEERNALQAELGTLQGERSDIVAGRNASAFAPFYETVKAADFEQNSQYDPSRARMEDVLYSFINGQESVQTSALNPIGVNAPASTSDPNYAFKYLTDEEKSIYNYLVNTSGDDKAFLEAVRPYANKRMRDAVEAEARMYAEDKPVLSSLETIVTSPATAIEGLIGLGKTGINTIAGRDTDPNDPVFQNTRKSSMIRETVANTIKTENQGFVGEALAMIYQTGMSMGDTAIRLPMGAAGLGTAGLSAAASAMDDALTRGASSGQALASGVLNGAAEIVFEKVSLDNLVSMSQAGNLRDIIKNILKQGGVEASEEAFTEIANTISDTVIMADKSAYETSVREYIAQGVDEQTARQKASMDAFGQIVSAGVGGFLSGGGFGAGGSVNSVMQTAALGRSVNAEAQINQGRSMPEDTEAYKLANKLWGKGEASVLQAGQQFIENQKALAAGARTEFESNVRASGIGEESTARALYLYDRLAEGKNISPRTARTFAKLKSAIETANTRRAEVEAELGVTRLELKTKLEQTYAAMTDAVEKGDINAFNKTKARYMAEYQVARAKTAAAEMKANNQSAEASRRVEDTVNEMVSETVVEDMKAQSAAIDRAIETEVANGVQNDPVPQRNEGEQRTGISAGNETARTAETAAGSESGTGRNQRTVARRGLESTPEAEAALYAHKEIVRRATGSDINARIINEVDETNAEMLDMIKSITGRDAFLYESDDSYGDGFAKDGQIFLRVNGSSHLAFLSGHEAAHADKRLVEAGMSVIENIAKSEVDAYAEYRRAEVGEDGANIERELISDMFGRMMFEVATGHQAEKDFGISKYTIDRFYDAFLQALSPDLETGGYVGEVAHAAADAMNEGGVEYSRQKNTQHQRTSRQKSTRLQPYLQDGLSIDVESSAAVVNMLGTDTNVAGLPEDVKKNVSLLAAIYEAVGKGLPLKDARKLVSADNLAGILAFFSERDKGTFKRSERGGTSVYANDGGRTLRVSDHNANASYFKDNGENLSAVLQEGKPTNEFKRSDDRNVVEVVFKRRFLNENPDEFRQLIKDLANFLVTGEYHDNIGAFDRTYSGSADVVAAMKNSALEDEKKGLAFSMNRLLSLVDAKDAEVLKRLDKRSSLAKHDRTRYAIYSEERIERELNESIYPGAYETAKSYIAWMNPLDFVYATTASAAARDAIKKEAGTLDATRLKEETQPIYLSVNLETGEIAGHEGRHRMMALLEAGADKVPVIIKTGRVDNAETIDTLKLSGQRFVNGRGTGFYLHDAIPLSGKYAGAARYLFTPKRNWRGLEFSRITFSDPDAYVDKDGKVMEYSYSVPEVKQRTLPKVKGKTLDLNDHIDRRDASAIANRSVLPFQVEYPQIQPYMQEMAAIFMDDLENSTRAERFPIYNGDAYKEITGWSGVKRRTTKEIEELLDVGHMTYDRIEKALDKIMLGEDLSGADVKRVEIQLDHALTEGHKSRTGEYDTAPNVDYIAEKAVIPGALPNSTLSTEDIDMIQGAAMHDADVPTEYYTEFTKDGKRHTVTGDTEEEVIKKALAIQYNGGKYYADVTLNGETIRMTGNDKAALEAEIRELKQKERMTHLSRPVQILRTANRLFRMGVTVEQYMEACWKEGEQYDVAVGRALIGMHLRNGNEVGGRLSDEKLLAITQNRGSFDIKGVFGTGAFKSLKLNMMSPVRVFEAAGAWRKGKDAEARALNYLEGEALKEVFFDPVMNAGAAANLFMERESELVKEKLEAIPKRDRQLMSSLVQLYGESLLTEEETSMARFGEEGMIARHEDERGNLFIYVFDKNGRLQALERPRYVEDEVIIELLVFDDNYHRRMKEAEKDIEKFLAGKPSNANEREKGIQEILQRAKQNLPVVLEGQHLVVVEGQSKVVVETPAGRQLLKLENPKSPDIQKVDDLMQTLRAFYTKAHEEQSKVLVAAGYKPVPIRGNSYFPHMTREPVGIVDSIATFLQGKPDSLPTDIVGRTGQFKPGKSFAAHLLTREGLMTEYDAIRGFNRYVRAAADIIYYTPAIQRLRQLENFLREEAEDKRTDIEGAPNNAFVAWLQEYTNAIANKKHSMDRGGEALLGRESYTFTDKLTGLFGAASVSGNIATALSNNISLLTAIPGLNAKYIAKAAKDSWKSAWAEVIKGGTYDRFIEKIPFLARRLGSYEALLTDKAKMAGRKVNNVLGAMFAFTDRFAVETAARAKYAELMARGDPDAVRKTNEFLLKNFADRSKGMTPTIYNMRFLRLLTQFQLEGQNQFSHLRDINRAFIEKQVETQLTQEQIREIMTQGYGDVDWKKIKIHTKDPKKFALKFLYFALLSLWGTFTRWALGRDQSWNLYGMAADFVGEVNEGDIKGAFSKLGQDVVDQIPFVQTLTGGGRIPALGGIENVIDAAVAIFDDESTGDFAKITQGAATFVPGGAQISKTLRGIDAYVRGGSYSGKGNLRYPVEQNTQNFVKSILFGPAASQPARFDYLTDTLSEKKTEAYQELVEAGVKPQTAYDGLQAYKGENNAEKLTSLAEADVDEKTRKMIAKMMGIDIESGSVKSQAKEAAENYLENKESQYKNNKISKEDLEDADRKTQALLERLMGIK